MTDSRDGTDAPIAIPAPSPGGGRSMPVTVAGIWFVVAGLGLVAPSMITLRPIVLEPWSTSNPFSAYAPVLLVSILSGGAIIVGLIAAYVVFARAGFPRRSGLMTFVTISLAVVSPLVALARFGFIFGTALEPLAAVAPVLGGALLLVFSISAARNHDLPLGLRILPAVQFLLALLASLVYTETTLPVNINGIAFLGVGTAYIVLAAHARDALEAAAAR